MKIMTLSSRVHTARTLVPPLLLAFLVATLLMAASAMAAPLNRVTGSVARAGQRAGSGLAATSTFTAALSADVQGLDPALLTDASSLLVTDQIYDTLMTYEPGGTAPSPALAGSWTVAPDGKTWTLNLRPGVTFHDGTSLDAAAVVFNLERWWDPANPYHEGSFDAFQSAFGGFKGNPDCLLAGVGTAGTLLVGRSRRVQPFGPVIDEG